jgi:hypothetical protein
MRPLLLLQAILVDPAVIHYFIERPDQGHLYPLGEPRDTCHSRGANLRPPAPQARALPKELSRQLIAGYSELLLGASGRPPQGSPSACVYMDSNGCRPNSPCKALGFIPFQGPRLHTLQVRLFSNHVGVTTIERPDQGHLYPLGEPRDTCHSRGANPDPLHRSILIYWQ